MSLKTFRRKGKEAWDAETQPLKHPSDYRDRQILRKVVKELKKLAHKQDRLEGKKIVEEYKD